MKKITHISDNLYYDERSAGGLVFKIENGQVWWLVIKVLSSGKFRGNTGKATKKSVFKFPKGHLQRGEFLKAAALREAEEEGKVKAEIVSKIGSNNYVFYDKIKRQKIIKKVTFFLMRYLGQSDIKYADAEIIIDRQWMSYEEASKNLAYDSEKILLKRARQRLDELLKLGKTV